MAGVPPPTGKKELHDLCAQEAGMLHGCFRVIHATPPSPQSSWPPESLVPTRLRGPNGPGLAALSGSYCATWKF